MADEQEQQSKDQTVPGGAYIVGGLVVDANGKPRPGWMVSQDGTAVPPAARKSSKKDAGSAGTSPDAGQGGSAPA